MSNYHQKKLMTIAFFALYLVLFVMTIAHFAKPIKADASGYYPPRIQQLCYDNWYGTDWNKSKKYEKRCRVLWNAWTEEEKSNSPY